MSIARIFALSAASAALCLAAGCATEVSSTESGDADTLDEGADALRTKKFIGTWRTNVHTNGRAVTLQTSAGDVQISAGVRYGYEFRVLKDGSYTKGVYTCAADSTRCVTHPGIPAYRGTWERGGFRTDQLWLKFSRGIQLRLLARPLELTTSDGVQNEAVFMFKHKNDDGLSQLVITNARGPEASHETVYREVSDDPTFAMR